MADQRTQLRESKEMDDVDSNVYRHPNNNIDSKTNVYKTIEDRNMTTKPPIGIRTPGRGSGAKTGEVGGIITPGPLLLYSPGLSPINTTGITPHRQKYGYEMNDNEDSLIATRTIMLMTPLTTPFDKQGGGNFDNDDLDRRYSAGREGGDDYDDIDRICEAKNTNHLIHDNKNNMDDKNHIDVGKGLQNKYNENSWKDTDRNDSDDDCSRSLLMQSYLASPSSSVILKKNNADYDGKINDDDNGFLDPNHLNRQDNVKYLVDENEIDKSDTSMDISNNTIGLQYMSLLRADEDWRANSLMSDVQHSPLLDKFIQRNSINTAIDMNTDHISTSLFEVEGGGNEGRGVGRESDRKRDEKGIERGREASTERNNEIAVSNQKGEIKSDEIKERFNMIKDIEVGGKGEEKDGFYRNMKDSQSMEYVNNKYNIIAALNDSVEIETIGSKNLNLNVFKQNSSHMATSKYGEMNRNKYDSGYNNDRDIHMNDIFKNNDGKNTLRDEVNEFDSSPLFFRKLQQQSELANSPVKPHQISSAPSSSYKPYKSSLSSHSPSSYPLPSNTDPSINFNSSTNKRSPYNTANDDHFTHRNSSISPHTRENYFDSHRHHYDNPNPNTNSSRHNPNPNINTNTSSNRPNPNPNSNPNTNTTASRLNSNSKLSSSRQDHYGNHRHSFDNPNPNQSNPNTNNDRDNNRNYLATPNKNVYSNYNHVTWSGNDTNNHGNIINNNYDRDNFRYYLATPNENNTFNNHNNSVTPTSVKRNNTNTNNNQNNENHNNNNNNNNNSQNYVNNNNNVTPANSNMDVISIRSPLNAYPIPSTPNTTNSTPLTSNSSYPTSLTPNNIYPNPPNSHNTYTPITPNNIHPTPRSKSKSPLYRVVINESGLPLLVPFTDMDDLYMNEDVPAGEIGVGGIAIGGVGGNIVESVNLSVSPLLVPSVNVTQDVAGSNVGIGVGVGVERNLGSSLLVSSMDKDVGVGGGVDVGGSLGSPLLIPSADKDDLDVTEGSARNHVKIGDSLGDSAAENSSSKEQISDIISEGIVSATFKDSYAQTDRNDLHDQNQLQQHHELQHQQQKQQQKNQQKQQQLQDQKDANEKFQSPISNNNDGLYTPPHIQDEYGVQNSDDKIYNDNERKNVSYSYCITTLKTESSVLKIMDTESLIKGSVKEYLGSRTHFRSIELAVKYSLNDHSDDYMRVRVRVCTYQGQPLYIIEKKGEHSASYVEVIALQDLNAAAFMITIETRDEEVLENMKLRYLATKETVHFHQLTCHGFKEDRGKSLVEQYLNVIAVSIAPTI